MAERGIEITFDTEDFFIATLTRPESTQKEVTDQVTMEVTMEVARLLPFCLQPVNRRILQEKFGLSNADHFRKAYILPAIKGGWIEMTISDKPKSRLQKYILTGKGRKWLEENPEKAS
ncbi:MAG: hypothetical protein JRJ21_11675 [Deltaproteobacteria bacterium]|nr:hypothetical protein [Deltaproteobacteria bacterium]